MVAGLADVREGALGEFAATALQLFALRALHPCAIAVDGLCRLASTMLLPATLAVLQALGNVRTDPLLFEVPNGARLVVALVGDDLADAPRWLAGRWIVA